MNQGKEIHKNFLFFLINASAGVYRQYQLTFWGQLVFGFLYSFGYFELKIVGFMLGFFMPVMWIFLTYRFVFHKAKEQITLPFPGWMQKNPGNILVILIDTLFLGFIWIMILTEWYDPTWLKIIFTMVLPILTLSMLRNLVISFNDETNLQDGDLY